MKFDNAFLTSVKTCGVQYRLHNGEFIVAWRDKNGKVIVSEGYPDPLRKQAGERFIKDEQKYMPALAASEAL